MGILNTLGFIVNHPLNETRKLASIIRFARWQIGSRLVDAPVAKCFVDRTRLLVSRGMPGATLNIYAGLHEFEDMAFVLHLLRKDDLFVDVGANIGSYTILAGGAVGARCISVEPIKYTFEKLKDNINLNRLSGNVQAMNMGIGNEKGVLKFTAGLDCMNHVVANSEQVVNVLEVPVTSLNDLLENQHPILIKIDVEGFETNVIAGADKVLSQPSLLAVIMELNGSGNRYCFDEQTLHQSMLDYGFKTYKYNPFLRDLESLRGKNHASGNILYLRNIEEVSRRLKHSEQYLICAVGKTI